MLEIFRHVIQQTTCSDRDDGLQDDLQDVYRVLIKTDFVLCEQSTISSKESRAVYRATLYSSPNNTVQIISSLLENLIKDGEFTDNAVLTGFQVDKTCPTSLHRGSEPLCSDPDCPDSNVKLALTGSLSSPNNCSCETDNSDVVVTLPLVITALVAELFLIVFVIMFVAALVIGIRRR